MCVVSGTYSATSRPQVPVLVGIARTDLTCSGIGTSLDGTTLQEEFRQSQEKLIIEHNGEGKENLQEEFRQSQEKRFSVTDFSFYSCWSSLPVAKELTSSYSLI